MQNTPFETNLFRYSIKFSWTDFTFQELAAGAFVEALPRGLEFALELGHLWRLVEHAEEVVAHTLLGGSRRLLQFSLGAERHWHRLTQVTF